MPHAVSSRCFAYLALFRSPGKSLQWKTVLRLLSELKEWATLSDIQWIKKVARPNSAHAWGMAMERMIEHPPKGLPLKSHGYLRAIAYDIADEEDKQREIKRNQKEKYQGPARRHSREGGNPVAPERVSLEIMKDLRKQNMGKGKEHR
jgi:hypothetical protein